MNSSRHYRAEDCFFFYVVDIHKYFYNLDGQFNRDNCTGKKLFNGSKMDELREEDVRLEKLYFENLFKAAPEAIVITDNDSRILRVNDQFTVLFGYTAAEVIGNTTRLLLTPDDKIAECISFNSLVKKERTIIKETVRLKKDGTPVFVSIVGSPITIDKNRIGIFKIFRNISEQKVTEEALLESQEKLRSIFQNSPDAIILTTIDGIVIDRNNAAFDLFGSSDKNQGKKFSLLKLVTPRDHKRTLSFIKAVIRKENVKNKTFTLVKDNRKTFIAEISASLLKNKNMEPANLIIIVKDITERLLYERRLEEAKEKAIESDKLKSAFLANMSHEIRTPMNAIIGFSKLLSSNEINEPDNTEYIEIIKNTGNSLLTLIDDIIDLAKIEAGEININQAACDVHKVMKELHTFFNSERERQNKNNVTLILKIPGDQKELTILTDHNRFRQIFSNLLSNAIKFTKKGNIELGYNIDNKNIEFYVSDTGIGIPKEKQKIIFERFRQVEFHYNKKFGGTGLGLAISKNLVTLLGGTIAVDSEKGKGSVFRFTLPLVRMENSNEIVKQPPVMNIHNWKGKVILIVEDNDLNSRLLQRMIEPTGAEIIIAKDGKPAIEACMTRETIDIVLMDIQMPEMDGYEATRTIKSLNPQIPVIAQTAYAMAEEKEKIIFAGCDDYISKPIRQKDLFITLSKYLNK